MLDNHEITVAGLAYCKQALHEFTLTEKRIILTSLGNKFAMGVIEILTQKAGCGKVQIETGNLIFFNRLNMLSDNEILKTAVVRAHGDKARFSTGYVLIFRRNRISDITLWMHGFPERAIVFLFIARKMRRHSIEGAIRDKSNTFLPHTFQCVADLLLWLFLAGFKRP